MSVEITIICDACAQIIAADSTAARARADLRERGGRAALPGGRDFCSHCARHARVDQRHDEHPPTQPPDADAGR